jgi:hypothetical protein
MADGTTQGHAGVGSIIRQRVVGRWRYLASTFHDITELMVSSTEVVVLGGRHAIPARCLMSEAVVARRDRHLRASLPGSRREMASRDQGSPRRG